LRHFLQKFCDLIHGLIIPTLGTATQIGIIQRHLNKWTAKQHVPVALFASLVVLMAAAKKEEKKAIKTALVVGT